MSHLPPRASRGHAARLQDEAGADVEQAALEAHRVLVRVHEALDAGVQPAELGLRAEADLVERRALMDDSAPRA